MIHNFKGRKKSQDIELMGFVIKINEYITSINVTNSKFYKIILYKNWQIGKDAKESAMSWMTHLNTFCLIKVHKYEIKHIDIQCWYFYLLVIYMLK